MKEHLPFLFSRIQFGLIAIFISACSGGSGGDSNNTEDTESNGSEGSSSVVTIGQYDLTTYLFHQNLDLVGGKVSYEIKLYSKVDGTDYFPSLMIEEEYEKVSEDTVIFKTNGSIEPENTFQIKDSTIQETVHTLENQTRDIQRFVDIGTKHLDADGESILGAQNASCTLIEHLDSFDLRTATGSFNLASGVYDDVLHIQCITGLIVDDAVVPHTDLHHYFANNFGPILTEGTILLLGEAYIVPQR